MKQLLGLLLLLPMLVIAGQDIATMRSTNLLVEPEAPRLENEENKDLKRKRSYPMQPPTIPHKVAGYRVDLNSNKCLSCHSRRRVAETQAPMVSVTHYMDRDGNFLAEVSPRRYFCNQCHVPQMEVRPLVDNTFQDVDNILKNEQAQ